MVLRVVLWSDNVTYTLKLLFQNVAILNLKPGRHVSVSVWMNVKRF